MEATALERALDASTATTAAADKANTHWRDWEYGCLIDLCVEGKPFEIIGGVLNRTGAACDRMWKRLLDGEADCPVQYRPRLEQARLKFLPHAKPAANRRGTEAMLDQVRQQYIKLAAEVLDIKTKLRETLCMLSYCLARDMASHPEDAGEVSMCVYPDVVNRLEIMAAVITNHRKAQQAKTEAEAPVVMTGPGGEFVRKTYAADLAGKPADQLDATA